MYLLKKKKLIQNELQIDVKCVILIFLESNEEKCFYDFKCENDIFICSSKGFGKSDKLDFYKK